MNRRNFLKGASKALIGVPVGVWAATHLPKEPKAEKKTRPRQARKQEELMCTAMPFTELYKDPTDVYKG